MPDAAPPAIAFAFCIGTQERTNIRSARATRRSSYLRSRDFTSTKLSDLNTPPRAHQQKLARKSSVLTEQGRKRALESQESDDKEDQDDQGKHAKKKSGFEARKATKTTKMTKDSKEKK
jgi:hypothetical protein